MGRIVPAQGNRKLMEVYVLHCCNVKDVVSSVACEKVLMAFLLKPSILSTREAVGATRQAKLSTMVPEAWHYDVPFPRCQKLQTDRHTRNTAIYIIDIRTHDLSDIQMPDERLINALLKYERNAGIIFDTIKIILTVVQSHCFSGV